MCLVTVHRDGGQVVSGGHCSNGEYRFIASPSSVFSEQPTTHGDDGDFPGGCTASVGTYER